MRFARMYVPVFLSLVLTIPTVAQQAVLTSAQSSPQRDSQALSILSQAFAAMGGSALASNTNQTGILISGVRTETLGGNITSTIFRVKMLGPNSVRWELDTAAGAEVIVISNSFGWGKSPAGLVSIAPHELAGWGFETLPLFVIWQTLADSSANIIDDGLEAMGASTVRHITLRRTFQGLVDDPLRGQLERMNQCELYVDTQTLLPVKLRYYIHPVDWRVNKPVDVVFSNFKAEIGLLLPHTAVQYLNNQTLGAIQFQAFSLDTSITGTDFEAR